MVEFIWLLIPVKFKSPLIFTVPLTVKLLLFSSTPSIVTPEPLVFSLIVFTFNSFTFNSLLILVTPFCEYKLISLFTEDKLIPPPDEVISILDIILEMN